MLITVETVMALGPCESWTEDRVRSYLGDGVSPAQLAEILIRITPEDAYWLLAYLLPPKEHVEWACRCAERVLPIWEAEYPDDDRPRRAIEAARPAHAAHAAHAAVASDAAYAARAAYAAARTAALAAYAAARTAALAADDDHAADAAYAAARTAASAASAASAAETEWQIREACRMLEAES